MELYVSLHGPDDVAENVYQQIRAAIADGRLRSGEQLPSGRELARRLAVSRNTVGIAYDRLAAEGLVSSRIGAGTYVTRDAVSNRVDHRFQSPLRARPVWNELPEPDSMPEEGVEFDFRPGRPDTSRFPFATWRSLVAGQLRSSSVGSACLDPAGHPDLRSAIARHVGVARAVRADAEDVIVTRGSPQALDLLTRVLLEPGDIVAVEDPGYLAAHHAFTAHGVHVVGIPVDEEGLVVEALPDIARLVYVTPANQYPLGVVMSMRRRLALLEWADRADATIVEDDYDGEFHFGGRPLPPLRSLDSIGRVVYVGSLSKVMLPALRLGFLVAPRPLHVALRKAKRVADGHIDTPAQAAAASFIMHGHLVRHVRRMRGVYGARHHLIRSQFDAELGDRMRVIPTAAGLHLAATFPADAVVDDARIVERARTAGVAVDALSRHRVDRPRCRV